MLKEEFRYHTSFSNKYGFFLFPIMILILTVILAVTAPQLFQQLNYEQIILSLHTGLFLYGISMGSFAFLGREYVERSSGRINFLISSPVLLPIKFRRTFSAFYIHDVIFYYFMVIIPFTIGLILTIPIMGYNFFTIIFLSFTLFISFITGLSFSFFMSAIFIKNLYAFVTLLGVISFFLIALIVTNGEIGLIIPALRLFLDRSITFLILALTYVAAFSAIAVYLIEEKFEIVNSNYKNRFPEVYEKFRFFKKYPFLLAKEYLDLVRSRTMTKIAFSFILPLLFITFISWILKSNLVLEIEFNSIFYASMVGFFSVMIYYWLTNTDNMESFQSLPINVPTIIKSKLIMFIIISTFISSIYLVIISTIYNELHLIGISLFIMLITSFYIATSTAYLTGLRTQSYLFNMEVLVKFSILSALPLTCLEIIILNLNTYWFIATIALGLTSLIMFIATMILYQGIERKWADAEFI
jgi:hypothetical protein